MTGEPVIASTLIPQSSLRRRAALWTALGLGIVMWAVVGPLTKVPLWGDEGQHLNGAKHVLESSDRWFRPVFDPGDSQHWTTAEIENCHFPPILISLYALSLSTLGNGSLAFGTPLVLAHLISAVGLFFLCRRLFGAPTAALAVILWIWAPAGLRRGSQIMAEPLLVCFGVVALALVTESMHRRSRWLALAAGACLGLAFLAKLWLAGPFVLMALAMVAGGERGERLRLVPPLVVGGLITGGLHLVVVAASAPDLLGTWGMIYFDLILSRIHPASQPRVVTRPLWEYFPLLYRDHWPLMLPLAACAWALIFRRGEAWTGRAVRNMFLAALGSLVILSIYQSKTPLYVYYLAPVLVLAAARGVTILAEAGAAETQSLSRWLGVALGVFVLATGAAWVGWTQAKWPSVLTATYCISHVLAAAWLLVLILRESRWRRTARTMGFLAVPLAAGLVTGIETVQAHREDSVEAVAEFFAAQSPSAGDSEVRFVSSRWHALGFHLWRQGRPWAVAEHESVESDILGRLEAGELDFVEMDRDFQIRPGALSDAEAHDRVLTWLRDRAVDVTPRIEQSAGRPLNTYVFVAKSSAVAAGGVAIAASGKSENHVPTNPADDITNK